MLHSGRCHGTHGRVEMEQPCERGFAATVPKLEFSPAKIMSLLLANKQSPRHAIADVVVEDQRRKEEFWAQNKFGDAQ